jgi:hypothetical protein
VRARPLFLYSLPLDTPSLLDFSFNTKYETNRSRSASLMLQTLSYQRLQAATLLPVTDAELADHLRWSMLNKHELQVLEAFLVFNKCVFRLQSALCGSLWKGFAREDRDAVPTAHSLWVRNLTLNALPTAPFALANPTQTHPQDKILPADQGRAVLPRTPLHLRWNDIELVRLPRLGIF